MPLELRPEGETAIVVIREFAATREAVFRAFTEANSLLQWMGTPSHPITRCEIDLRPGGQARYEWGTMGLTATYVSIDAPRRIEHTERFDEDWTGGPTRVVTTFDASPLGTTVRMEITYSSREARDAVAASPMQFGLELNYLSLDDHLAGRQPLFVVDPEKDLVLERIVPVPPSKVWSAWTEPQLLVQWFTPAPWRTESARVRPVPGGPFDVVMAGPNGERNDSKGCVLQAVPNRLLVWTDALSEGFRPQAEPFMTGILVLTPHLEGTHYRAVVRHVGPEARAQHAQMGFEHGWGTALDQLVQMASQL